MSFASDVKSENIRAASDEKCCLQAELNAPVKFGIEPDKLCAAVMKIIYEMQPC